jgi:5'-3' exonuclease
VKVHLVDGTFELFRQYFGQPSHLDDKGIEVAATRGVIGSLLGMLDGGATHMGVATDHVIESFRNDMWPGYKSSAGVPAELLAQFPLLEEAISALGVVVWPMIELEADDALASAAATAAADAAVDQVLICTPDKDLAQCVVDRRVVQLDRRRRPDGRPTVTDEAGVVAKFGVAPASIPDYLALVGDSSDGYPGLQGWGAKSTATVLARYGHIEDIPELSLNWNLSLRGGKALASTLAQQKDLALLFRDLATLRVDPSLLEDVASLRWREPAPEFAALCRRLGADDLRRRADALATKR